MQSVSPEEVTYQDNVAICAQRLSRKMEEAFMFEVRKAELFLPHKNLLEGNHPIPDDVNHERSELITIFADYLIGTAAALMGTYTNIEEEGGEKYFKEVLSDKFSRLRQMKNEVKNGLTQA